MRFAVATAAAAWLAGGQPATATQPNPQPESLKATPRPEPSNLGDYVASKTAAIRLGKALFWDMQVGSDGKTACASCHFAAGADNRSKNQLTPGLLRMQTPTLANPDTTFQLGGPNYQLKLDDFPFHQFANVDDRNSAVLRSINDAATSQGVFNDRFIGVAWQGTGTAPYPAAASGKMSYDPYENAFTTNAFETRTLVPDPTFHVGYPSTRRVEPRNSPTVINAVFNFRNFWDGRAQYLFNGVNPFGARDPNAVLYKNTTGVAGATTTYAMTPVQVRIDNASLASQAAGPPGSTFEMSAAGRSFPHLGKKMLYLRPLSGQQVSLTDGVLGSSRHSSGYGLSQKNYAQLVREAFQPAWWSGSQLVEVQADGTKKLVPLNANPQANQFSQMQYNFSLFFSLAIQLYEATLVSDDAPFDRYVSYGDTSGMSQQQLVGLGLFFGKGNCASCHSGAEFTSASVRNTLREPLERMVMGNGGTAVYDNGFYNIGVRPTLDDLGNGGPDDFGKPLSLTAIAQQFGSGGFNQLIGIGPNLVPAAGERIAVNGAFKTPGLRNVELTSPYFHNGSAATLRQVVEFYNRGGNFHAQNIADLDPDVENLGFSEDEKTALVEFLRSLTDDRVRQHKAPFDHPQIFVPAGHAGDAASVVDDGSGRAADQMVEIAAVGSSGYAKSAIPANFLGTANSGTPSYQLVARHSGKCAAVSNALLDPLGLLNSVYAQANCGSGSSQRFKAQAAKDGAFNLIAASNGKALETSLLGALGLNGSQLDAGLFLDGLDKQVWRLVDLGNGYHQVRHRPSNRCMEVSGGSTAAGAAIVLWDCSSARMQQQFRLQ